MDKFLVISCDGGGIRGVIPALLLQDLTQEVLDNVNLYAGTSTGSVIALSLAGGVPIDQVVDYYQDPEICAGFFSPYEHQVESEEMHQGIKKLLEAAAKKVESKLDETAIGKLVSSLLYPQYSNEGRLQVLKTMLPSGTVADLLESHGKFALAATFELNVTVSGQRTWMPTVISNLPENNRLEGISLVDAAMCSTSAPLGYAAWQLDNGVYYADGAVYANNPSAVALATLSNSGVLGPRGLERVFLLSLGTGFNFGSYPIEEGLPGEYPWGMLGWLWPHETEYVEKFPLISAYSAGSLQSADLVSRELLGRDRFRRGNVDLSQSISFSACDKVSLMTELTQEYMATDEWREIKGWVAENFV